MDRDLRGTKESLTGREEYMNPFDFLKKQLDQENLWTKSIELKRNNFLKVKGSTDTNIYFVETGSLRIFMEDEFEEHTIRFAYPGSFFAALDSFISGKPSPFFIQALKKCQLLVLSKSIFLDFIQRDSERTRIWQQMMEQLILQQMEREIDILTHSPMERYQRVLARSPHLFQEIPAKYIASYLRMTPETLSRRF